MEEKRKSKKLFIIISAAVILLSVIIAIAFTLRKNNTSQAETTLASDNETTNWAEALSDAGLSPVNTKSDSLSEGLCVDFLNVGQGDCAVITCNSECMIIDSGEKEYYQVIRNFLLNKGISKIDVAMISHPHTDHFGSMSSLLEDFDVDTLVMPEIKSHEDLNNKSYEDFIKSLKSNSIQPHYPDEGEKIYLGGAEIEILGPVEEDEEINNMSIVAMLRYGKSKFLFTGDAQKEEEIDIVERGKDLTCDVLKVSHHGSSDSSDIAFIKASSADTAVISVGEYNEYNHPNGVTLKNLLKEDINIYRTDFDGTVSFYVESETSDIITRNV